MSTKTPAMVLQELTVKRCLPPPEYILEHCRMGTHDNEFHYKVVVTNAIGKGFGRSKQVAKHMAAKQALEILTQNGLFDPNMEHVRDFDVTAHRNDNANPFELPVNSIGVLKEKCLEQKLPYPEFIEISDVGPPHCRIFTYKCKLNSLLTQATANTKKQAKQLAARDMLEKVRTMYPDVPDELPNALTNEKVEEVISKYHSLTEQQNQVVPNRTLKIEDISMFWSDLLLEKKITLADFSEQMERQELDDFNQIMEALDLKYDLQPFLVETDDVSFSILKIFIEVPFTVIGFGNNFAAAKQNAIIKAFDLLKSFLS